MQNAAQGKVQDAVEESRDTVPPFRVDFAFDVLFSDLGQLAVFRRVLFRGCRFQHDLLVRKRAEPRYGVARIRSLSLAMGRSDLASSESWIFRFPLHGQTDETKEIFARREKICGFSLLKHGTFSVRLSSGKGISKVLCLVPTRNTLDHPFASTVVIS
jgi:hypothetical protein